MGMRTWGSVVVALVVLVHVADGEGERMCARVSAVDAILGTRDSCSVSDYDADWFRGIFEGNEYDLKRAINLVYRLENHQYVAILFHASWCPFSKVCRSNYDTLSSLFPTIRHFAFEESNLRPLIFRFYEIHGFPTLLVLNSTMHRRYHRMRTDWEVDSLVRFYNDVTGIKPASLYRTSVEKVDASTTTELNKDMEQKNSLFSWAQALKKFLQEEVYLGLASLFVLLKTLYFLLPKLNSCIRRTWRWQLASITTLFDYNFQDCFKKAKQGLSSLIPRKRSNIQEGAMNAKAWASKSLASIAEVSISESSSSSR